MAARIIFIHGAWLTPRCWDDWVRFFAEKGYACATPAWPLHGRPVELVRADPPAGLARIGFADIVERYAALVRIEKTPPILIGHSFGGLIVQILLDRGLGAAGVAITPAAPRGVSPLRVSSVKATAPFLLSWGAWWKTAHLSFPMFQYAFTNGLPRDYQEREYARHIVPESALIFFQLVLAPLMRRSPTAVNFRNTSRKPLLIIGGGTDTIVPASVVRTIHRRFMKAGVATDYKEFPDRCHWMIAGPGWEEIADYAAQWLAKNGPEGAAPRVGSAPYLVSSKL